MAILRFVPLLLVACYSPDVRDCVVACTAAADCAPEQVCGGDGFCAAPSIAGTCKTIAASDAGIDAPDPTQQPEAGPDGPPPPNTVRLWVRIEGRGVVTLPAIGDCDGSSGQMECMFEVPKNVPTTLHATPKNNWRFKEWKDACEDAATATCVLTPTTDSDVRARFEMLDDD